MLQRGEVFACVENMLVVDRAITQLKMSDIKISGSTPYNNAQCMAVRKDWAILAGILDQALDSISATERSVIFRKWLPLQYESAFDCTRLWPVAAIIVVVLLGFGTWNWKLAAEIRQRKQAEAALREVERRYRSLFDHANEGFFLMTPEGHLTEVNQAFAKMHGYTVEEMKNLDLQALDVLSERETLCESSVVKIQLLIIQNHEDHPRHLRGTRNPPPLR